MSAEHQRAKRKQGVVIKPDHDPKSLVAVLSPEPEPSMVASRREMLAAVSTGMCPNCIARGAGIYSLVAKPGMWTCLQCHMEIDEGVVHEDVVDSIINFYSHSRGGRG